MIAVGGITQSKEGKKFVDSIFILDLVNGNKWERLTVSLPDAAASVGLFQQSEDRIMIFGGYSSTNAKNGTLVCNLTKSQEKGFVLSKSKYLMEKADCFLINGVWQERNGEFLVAGVNHIHKLS